MYTNYLASAEEQEGEGTQPTGNFLTRFTLLSLVIQCMTRTPHHVISLFSLSLSPSSMSLMLQRIPAS